MDGLLSTRTQTLKRLVTHAEKGGVLETHKDVPDKIGDELYIKEQQRLEKDKRKTGNILGGSTPYLSININVHPSHLSGLDIKASNAAANPSSPNDTPPLKIPRFRDVAVKEHGEYGEWLASAVSDRLRRDSQNGISTSIRHSAVEGFDLEHVYKDQNPGFFVGNGVKLGIAPTFREYS